VRCVTGTVLLLCVFGRHWIDCIGVFERKGKDRIGIRLGTSCVCANRSFCFWSTKRGGPTGKSTNQSKKGSSSSCKLWLASTCLEQSGFIVRRCLLTGFLLLLFLLLPPQRGSVKVGRNPESRSISTATEQRTAANPAARHLARYYYCRHYERQRQ
jgi:hypothetical protein